MKLARTGAGVGEWGEGGAADFEAVVEREVGEWASFPKVLGLKKGINQSFLRQWMKK